MNIPTEIIRVIYRLALESLPDDLQKEIKGFRFNVYHCRWCDTDQLFIPIYEELNKPQYKHKICVKCRRIVRIIDRWHSVQSMKNVRKASREPYYSI